MKEQEWNSLESAAAACRRCGLCETRKNLVFGVGKRDAELMLIGEGPGEQEDLRGEPFVGPAGQLLDLMLELIGLDRSKLYIGNMVKCRPPQNRDPRPEELQSCSEWIHRQIELVDPKIIVCLGRIAAQALIQEDFRITRQHGQFFTLGGRELMAIYHPSALLRDPDKRPETFEDLVRLRERLREACPSIYTE